MKASDTTTIADFISDVFEQYPTWEDALDDSCNYFGNRTAKNSNPVLTKYFV